MYAQFAQAGMFPPVEYNSTDYFAGSTIWDLDVFSVELFSCTGLLNLLKFTAHNSFLLLLTNSISVEDQLAWVNTIGSFEGFKSFTHHILQLFSNFLVLSLLLVS